MSKRIILVLVGAFCLLGVTVLGCSTEEEKTCPDGTPISDVDMEGVELDPVPDTGDQGDPALTWVAITGGTFNMGSELLLDMQNILVNAETNEYARDCYPTFDIANNEDPIHEVTVPDFQLLRTEVTVAQYRACVQAGVCDNLTQCGYSVIRKSDCMQRGFYNWGRPENDRGNHPVNCVTWEHARTFCEWAGGRLPTEAEWEYAATNGGTTLYPWGVDPRADRDEAREGFGSDDTVCGDPVIDGGVSEGFAVINTEPANAEIKGYGCGEWRTDNVCSRPLGNTANGLCDMAGNVWEWLQDHYHPKYDYNDGAPADGSAWVDELPDDDVLASYEPPVYKFDWLWPLPNADECDLDYKYPWELDESDEGYDEEAYADIPCRYCRTRRGSSFGSKKLTNWENLRTHNRSALWPERLTSDTGIRCAR